MTDDGKMALNRKEKGTILEGENCMHNDTNIVQLSYQKGTFSFWTLDVREF